MSLAGLDHPRRVTDVEPRCPSCGRLLAELATRPWRIRCSRPTCRATVHSHQLPEP